jgi:hypothetical protein
MLSFDTDVHFARRIRPNTHMQVFWLLGPYAVFTLAFGGIIVPKLNL